MLIFFIIKIKFWFILGLPYGAFIFSEDEKKKNEEKEEKLAEKHPEIFNKISDKGRFVDFENLTTEEMNEALWDHYRNMKKWNSLFIVVEFWNQLQNFIRQSHLQCCTNILKNFRYVFWRIFDNFHQRNLYQIYYKLAL